MSDCLPQEVIEEILLKLPLKDVVRYTAVCKAWNSSIKDPNFISTHTKKQKQKQANNGDDDLLLIRLWNSNGEHYSLHHDNAHWELYKHLDFPFNGKSHGPHFDVVASCNGLVFLADYSNASCQCHSLILWNPIIRKALILPSPSLTFATDGYKAFLGLGFDSKNNDHKVLRICERNDSNSVEAELFSLNANSWKTITASLDPKYGIQGRDSHAFVNGAIHWVGRNSIARFNVSDEVFDEIELPQTLLSLSPPLSIEVKNYGDSSIAVVGTKHRQLYIWTMAQYGMVDSWTQVLSGSTLSSKVLWFRKEEEILLQFNHLVFIDLVNLISLNVKNRRIHKLKDRRQEEYPFARSYVAHSYVESLILLDKGKPATPAMLKLASLDNDDDSNESSS